MLNLLIIKDTKRYHLKMKLTLKYKIINGAYLLRFSFTEKIIIMDFLQTYIAHFEINQRLKENSSWKWSFKDLLNKNWRKPNTIRWVFHPLFLDKYTLQWLIHWYLQNFCSSKPHLNVVSFNLIIEEVHQNH